MHRYHFKNHGHPLQDAVKIADMRKYEQEVRRIFNRLPKKQRAELSSVTARYCAPMHEHCRASVNSGNRFASEAGRRLVRVFAEVEPLTILTRISALHLMRAQQPHAFRDDRAFNFQLVRAFRKLASVADGSYWDQKRNRVKQICNEIPSRVRETCAEWLLEFSAPWVVHVNACATLIAKTERTQAMLATDVFAPLRAKLHQEHAKAERKLNVARRLTQTEDPKRHDQRPRLS